MAPAVEILYHNPSVTRPHRWAGERGRQLVAALVGAGADVRALPEVPVRAPVAAVGDRWRRVPPRWRPGLIRLLLMQRGTLNTVRWSGRVWRGRRSSPPDVLLARYHEYEWTPLAAARLLRRPLVLEVHAPFGLEQALPGGRPRRLAGWMDRVLFRKADIVWVHTPELGELVTRIGADRSRVRIIPFGVEDPGVRADPGREDPLVEVCFVGSFYPWHGIEVLLQAFARALREVPHLRLTVIGDGIVRSDCVELAADLGIDRAVSFPGWLDRDALYRRLQRAHIGVAPYQHTAYDYFEPVKIIDYQMVGLPVVASAVGHVRQMVEDGHNGLLVPPGDVQALASALVELAGDPDRRRRLGRESRRAARTIEETAVAVLDVCREAAVGRSQAAPGRTLGP